MRGRAVEGADTSRGAGTSPPDLTPAFLAHLRADVQLAHPEAFNVITGVRP